LGNPFCRSRTRVGQSSVCGRWMSYSVGEVWQPGRGHAPLDRCCVSTKYACTFQPSKCKKPDQKWFSEDLVRSVIIFIIVRAQNIRKLLVVPKVKCYDYVPWSKKKFLEKKISDSRIENPFCNV
jgi:hypothetical protein